MLVFLCKKRERILIEIESALFLEIKLVFLGESPSLFQAGTINSSAVVSLGQPALCVAGCIGPNAENSAIR